MLRFKETISVRPLFPSVVTRTIYNDHHWMVGSPKPLFGGGCMEVYATDAELVYIRNNFDHLPFPAGADKVVWKGDFAQFIYDNLRDESKKLGSFSIEPTSHSQQEAE
jgi:hypothetical protein